MFELFYGLYKEQTIDEILYTLISSTIVYGFGAFDDQYFRVDKKYFPKAIGHILCRIRADKGNSIDWDDIIELKKYFLIELVKCGYIVKIPLLGHIKSIRFKKKMKEQRLLLNENIRLYIEEKEIKYLFDIDINIPDLKFNYPKYDTFGSFYRDSLDIMNSAAGIRNGTIDLKRYETYYTISGEKRKI
jgi:hypothetical protein